VDEHRPSQPRRTARIHQNEAWDAHVKCESITDCGRPAEVIVHYAQECNVDLIVIGVRGTVLMTKVATHLFEGTAYKVACTAPCPVLTIRH
jgi:nucleotide-binding universal stress UspA family protein